MNKSDEDLATRAVQHAVLMERTRCLEWFRWARRTMKLDTAEAYIKIGTLPPKEGEDDV